MESGALKDTCNASPSNHDRGLDQPAASVLANSHCTWNGIADGGLSVLQVVCGRKGIYQVI